MNIVVVDAGNASTPRRKKVAKKLAGAGSNSIYTHDGRQWDREDVPSELSPTCVFLHWTNRLQAFDAKNLKTVLANAKFRIAYSSDIFKEDVPEGWFRQEKRMQVDDYTQPSWSELAEWLEEGCNVHNLPYILRPLEEISHLHMLGLMCDAYWLTNTKAEELSYTGIPRKHLRKMAVSNNKDWFANLENWKLILGNDLLGALKAEVGTLEECVTSFVRSLDEGTLLTEDLEDVKSAVDGLTERKHPKTQK